MKIGLLSICTMMFMLYGTDCCARDSIKDIAEMWEDSSDVESDDFISSSDEKYNKRAKEARIRKGNVKNLRKRFEEQEEQKDLSETETSNVKKKIKFFESQNDEEGTEKFGKRKFSRNRKSDDSDVSRDFVRQKREMFEQNAEMREKGDEEFSIRRKSSQRELDELETKGFVRKNREKFQPQTDESDIEETKVEQSVAEERDASKSQVKAKNAKNQRRNTKRKVTKSKKK